MVAAVGDDLSTGHAGPEGDHGTMGPQVHVLHKQPIIEGQAPANGSWHLRRKRVEEEWGLLTPQGTSP